MRLQAVQHWVLGFVVLATIFWIDLVPADLLRRIALFTLVWALASTVLVGSFGAWVALVRTRQQHSR